MTEPPRSPVRIRPHAEAARRSVFDLVAGAIGQNPPAHAHAPASAPTSGSEAVVAALNDSVVGAVAKRSEQDAPVAAKRSGTLVEGDRHEPSIRCNTPAMPSAAPLVPLARASQAAGPTTYSRKDKSLGVLCEKFIEQYGNGPGSKISLDTASTTLNVERRRIYDIINVLESLGCVYREAKNVYAWNTMKELLDKLEDLKCGRIRTGDLLQEATQTDPSTKVPLQPLKINSNCENIGFGITRRDAVTVGEAPEKPSSGTRKDKSLGILCQRFVQLFLVSSNQTVGLDEAATQLSDGNPLAAALQNGYLSKEASAKILKTKVRRLYDIANVLTSLCLIEKVSLRTRKPCFRWTGVNGNKALETLRGEPRHPSALTRPRPKFRPDVAPFTPLPPLKRRGPCAKEGGSGPLTAPEKGKRGPKRRKVAGTGEYAHVPSPCAVEQHLPAEYAAMFKQFVTYAEANGNINPLDAATAIAKAGKAASAAASLQPTMPQTRSAHDIVSETPKLCPGRTTGLLRQPLSSPVSTSDGGCDGIELPSIPKCTGGRKPSSIEGDARAGCENFQSPLVGVRVPGSPTNSVSMRDRGATALALSTPKRLMAAQQLSALSQAQACGFVHAVASTPASNGKDSVSRRKEANGDVASNLKAECEHDHDEIQASADIREPVAQTPLPSSVAESDMYRYATSPEAIDEYMCKAREAGPEFEAAANDWLANIRKWQSTWGNLPSLKNCQSSAPSPVTPASNLNLADGSHDGPGTPGETVDSQGQKQQSPGRA